MKKYLSLMVLILLVSLLSVNTLFADDGHANKGEIVKPELGTQEAGQIPGVNDYKVFDQGAIATQKAVRINGRISLPDTLLEDMVWSAYTDIWKQGIGVPVSQYVIMGSHNTQSNQSISEIWVNGAIKKSGQGWYNTAEHHTSGMFASCNTQMPDTDWWQTYIAHSWHHCYQLGYEQWNPETEDSMEG